MTALEDELGAAHAWTSTEFLLVLVAGRLGEHYHFSAAGLDLVAARVIGEALGERNDLLSGLLLRLRRLAKSRKANRQRMAVRKSSQQT